MLAGVRGRLITATFAQTVLPALPGAAPAPATVVRALSAWADRWEASIGPASSVRAITESIVIPLLTILGFDIGARAEGGGRTALAARRPPLSVPILVAHWGEPVDRLWREGVLDGVRADARWCFCCNGPVLRIVDAHRTWSRDYLEFDLALIAREQAALTLLWSVARAETLAASPPLLDRVVDLSSRHGVVVCKTLGRGVLEALTLIFAALSRTRNRGAPAAVLDDSLTVLYRVLFLLFAEARGLVPIWHPVYRDRYSIDTIVAALAAGRPYRGIWPAIQAISRLVSSGCAAGELKVTAFNGRLFTAEATAAFERARIGDEVMGPAVLALSTANGASGAGRVRIAYRDLDVEQLGAVYENVLEYEPVAREPARLDRTGDARKASGTFYTPRAVTAHLVRATLEPLIRGRGADSILQLRIVDPAMGSGAFLVAACRYLAAATEEALIREGRWHAADITSADRVQLRREVAQRCLFGVDLNPMAVQLARLSLWLATLAFEKPLTFLDHHLLAGDSLIGAAPEDLLRQPSRGARPSRRQQPLPLIDPHGAAEAIAHAAHARRLMASTPDDVVETVRGKEKALAALHARDSPLGRWSHVLDLWCAGWFWEEGTPPDAGIFGELCQLVLQGRASLPSHITAPFLDHAGGVSSRHRFLHWPLAFPEVFRSTNGDEGSGAGFDAVIGNPPWDMVRGDSGGTEMRSTRRSEAHRLVDFVREAGIYRVQTQAHINRYRLFVERALQIVRPGGRIGLVLPSGLMTDAGAAPLRRHLFERAEIDAITGLDNRARIFPIHRSVRFVLLSCTAGRPTTTVACRFGISRTEELDAPEARRAPLVVTRDLIARLSGSEDLALPEITTEADLRILEKISARVPHLGAAGGWHVRFARELNASDDRGHFVPADRRGGARLVLEGKHVDPFRVALDRCRHQLRDGAAAELPRRPRLAYRDVASATNRLTLIAAIVPARAVTTHTLFCLAAPVAIDRQRVLCALLNSFVANYLVRMRVNTHVTASLMARLPVPVIDAADPLFVRLATLSRRLVAGPAPAERMPEYIDLQALAAQSYDLAVDDFAHILTTFPLIASEIRSAALARFRELTEASHGDAEARSQGD